MHYDYYFIAKGNLETFYEFEERFNSLQRYYYFSEAYTKTYLSESLAALEQLEDPSSEQSDYLQNQEKLHDEVFFDAAFSEGRELEIQDDQLLFPQYIRGSVVSHIFSLCETLLADVTTSVAEKLGEPINLPERGPYLDRYISYLRRDCGLPITITSETWKQINTLREIRNRYIHKIDRELSEQIKEHLEDWIGSPEENIDIDNDYVIAGFETIGNVAGLINDAHYEFMGS